MFGFATIVALFTTVKLDNFKDQLFQVNEKLAERYNKASSRKITGSYKFSDLFVSSGDKWVIRHELFARFIMYCVCKNETELFGLFFDILTIDFKMYDCKIPFYDIEQCYKERARFTKMFNKECGISEKTTHKVELYGEGVEQLVFFKRIYDSVYCYYQLFDTVKVGDKLLLSPEPVEKTNDILTFRKLEKHSSDIIQFMIEFMCLFESVEFTRFVVIGNDFKLLDVLKSNLSSLTGTYVPILRQRTRVETDCP